MTLDTLQAGKRESDEGEEREHDVSPGLTPQKGLETVY